MKHRVLTSGILPWAAAVSVVAIWAETFVSSKVIIENGLEPADLFFFRFLIAYMSIWAVSHKRLFADSLKDEFRLFLLGITGGSLYFLAENTALKYSTASNTAILVGSAPLVTALIMACFYKEERMNLRQVAGSLLAFIGMALVIFNGQFILKLNPLGDALAIGAALTWGFYSLIIKHLNGRYDVAFITRKVFFYGLLTIAVYFIAVEPLHFDLEVLRRPLVWGNILYLGLVASMLCFLLWNWALSRLGTVRTTNLIYGQCFFTMVIAHFAVGEQITWMAILGTVVLVLGMISAVSES